MTYPLLACAPLVIITVAWAKIYLARHERQSRPIPFFALGIATANAALAASTFLFYKLYPIPTYIPPWENPEIGALGLLFFSATIAAVIGLVAAARGAAQWIVAVVEMASLPLVILGVFAGMAF